MNSAVQVSDLCKVYQLPASRRSGAAAAENVSDRTGGWLGRLLRKSGEPFWALKNVSFDVQPGEAVGIIGRNGAGKSTLLKVLSQITDPTAGRVELRGRVGSLLEVGTGFHPELSGRENIYLNAAILGMRRREVQRKFDDIVQFADVERFVDTPIKRYSSGMQVRLAFAVAAHIEPEILIIDEVLAVGDAEFQKRCTGKMRDVAAHGRTVLFVSHDLAAVQAMCQRAIWLQAGQLMQVGPAADVCRAYLQCVAGRKLERADRSGTPPDRPALLEFEVCDASGTPAVIVPFLEPASLKFEFTVPVDCRGVFFVLRLRSEDGRQKAVLASRELGHPPIDEPGRYEVTVQIPSVLCLPGNYSWEIGFFRTGDRRPNPDYEGLAPFEVTPKILPGASHAYSASIADFFLPNEMIVERLS